MFAKLGRLAATLALAGIALAASGRTIEEVQKEKAEVDKRARAIRGTEMRRVQGQVTKSGALAAEQEAVEATAKGLKDKRATNALILAAKKQSDAAIAAWRNAIDLAVAKDAGVVAAKKEIAGLRAEADAANSQARLNSYELRAFTQLLEGTAPLKAARQPYDAANNAARDVLAKDAAVVAARQQMTDGTQAYNDVRLKDPRIVGAKKRADELNAAYNAALKKDPAVTAAQAAYDKARKDQAALIQTKAAANAQIAAMNKELAAVRRQAAELRIRDGVIVQSIREATRALQSDPALKAAQATHDTARKKYDAAQRTAAPVVAAKKARDEASLAYSQLLRELPESKMAKQAADAGRLAYNEALKKSAAVKKSQDAAAAAKAAYDVKLQQQVAANAKTAPLEKKRVALATQLAGLRTKEKEASDKLKAAARRVEKESPGVAAAWKARDAAFQNFRRVDAEQTKAENAASAAAWKAHREKLAALVAANPEGKKLLLEAADLNKRSVALRNELRELQKPKQPVKK